MGASCLLGGKKEEEKEKSGEAHSHFLNVVPGIKCGTLAVFLTLRARVAHAWGLVARAPHSRM